MWVYHDLRGNVLCLKWIANVTSADDLPPISAALIAQNLVIVHKRGKRGFQNDTA
jgi:hypothetical protein